MDSSKATEVASSVALAFVKKKQPAYLAYLRLNDGVYHGTAFIPTLAKYHRD